MFTDTDSLAYMIETEDFYKEISKDAKDKFDTSNYAKHHPSGIPVGLNKKVIGMFKDECGGKNMQEFVGLRAKLYSYKMMWFLRHTLPIFTGLGWCPIVSWDFSGAVSIFGLDALPVVHQ